MSDFIKSDYCQECDGTGSNVVAFRMGFNPITLKVSDIEKREQCEECERLHGEEIRADILHDQMKGG